VSAVQTGAGPARIRPGVGGIHHLRELVTHLALRELRSMHRFTLLGWAWPLARQLAQFAVLLVVFNAVLDLGIPDYPAFVFSGLLAWGWFSVGVTQATSSMLAGRHLVTQPRFPSQVLPAVAVTVPLIDFAIALPVMLGILVFTTGIPVTIILLPVVVAIQLVLMAGIAWLTASAAVYVRDVSHIVGVVVLMVFYLTPVFYDHARVPPEYRWLFNLNPLTTLLTAYRDIMLRGELPDPLPLALLALVSGVLAAAGYAFCRKLDPGFVDQL
jgi:lipopolysaccharide transport system permease protein